MKKRFIIELSFILAIFFLVPAIKGVWAANLKFAPTSATTSIDDSFDVKVNVDTGGENILGVDARILYPANLLEVMTITDGDGKLLTIADKDSSETGKIYIAGIVSDPATLHSGTGTMVTITFKGKANGSGKLKFECTAGVESYDSDITKNDINTTDIIVCSQNNEAAITVGEGGSSPTSTPTPTSADSTSTDELTSTPTPTEALSEDEITPTPTALPKAGSVKGAFKYVAPGTILLLIGIGARLLL